MTRRQALAKATIDTTVANAGLLTPEQSAAFHRIIKDKAVLSSQMGFQQKTASSGVINKLSTGARLIRRATENADDGYRATAAFPTVPYQSVKIRLPWEVTEDTFHENIEGEALEAALTSEMTDQFALDLEDLAINGDTAAGAGPDQAFLAIDNGLIKLMEANVASGHQIDGSTINAGAISKDHFFAAKYAMPNKYVNQGKLKWIMSPNRWTSWIEFLTERAGASGDALIGGANGNTNPLGIEPLAVPSWPDDVIALANPANFVRIVTWDVRKRRVTGETDATLAAKDKRFFVFHIKLDTIVEEYDAIVLIDNLDPVA